jgi:NitT/TauT family transport system substrate-binding protein
MTKNTLYFSLLSFMLSVNTAFADTKKITLAGPAAVVSYPLMVMAEQQMLSSSSIVFSFVRWKNPDQLRAMVIGNQVDFSAMPSNLAAIFYNKGHQLTLLNISVWNIMDIISRDNKVVSLVDLIGKEIVIPFKNDMPSIIFEHLLNAQLTTKANQVKIRYSHNLADAAQLLLSGQVKHALLVEPLSSVALYQNSKKGNFELTRAINISQQWQQTFPNTPKLPQAGIIANTSVNTDKVFMSKVNSAYKKAALWCNTNVILCADIVKKYLPKMPKSALITAITKTKLEPIDSNIAKTDLQNFYQLLAEGDAKRIGGKQPDDNFYFSL